MSEEAPAHQGYERLLRQQLRAGEVLDGIFSSGPDRAVAITSERLIIVASSDHAGWELKAIPWRLLAELTSSSSETESQSAPTTIHLRYDVPDRNSGRKAAPRDADATEGDGDDEPQPTLPSNEVELQLPKRGGRMAAMLRARLASAERA